MSLVEGHTDVIAEGGGLKPIKVGTKNSWHVFVRRSDLAQFLAAQPPETVFYVGDACHEGTVREFLVSMTLFCHLWEDDGKPVSRIASRTPDDDMYYLTFALVHDEYQRTFPARVSGDRPETAADQPLDSVFLLRRVMNYGYLDPTEQTPTWVGVKPASGPWEPRFIWEPGRAAQSAGPAGPAGPPAKCARVGEES